MSKSGQGPQALGGRGAGGAETAALPVICANIRQRRLALGLEQKELAARLGVHKNTVSSWETGRTRPDVTLLPALCRALGLSPYALLSMEEPKPLCTPGEERLLGSYRALSAPFQAHAEAMLVSLAKAARALPVPALRALPFQSVRLAAGADAAIRDIAEAETLYLHDAPLLQRADSVYKVNGDSMEPTYRDGDLVLVERIPDGAALRFGEIGAFAVGNECYIKEYRADGLHSHNAGYGVMRFDGDAAVYLIGRVLGVVEPELLATPEEAARWLESRGQEEEQA